MPPVVVPDPSLVLLVGPAGSGKSTLAARLFEPDEVLSSDRLRAVLSGDEADQTVSRLAFGILHREAARRLRDGRLTVVDATNVRRANRQRLVDIAARAGVPAVAIVLDLPLEEVLRRNAGRARRVDEAVVRRQAANLAAAARTPGGLEREGFENVVRLDSPAAVEALRIERSRVSPRPG